MEDVEKDNVRVFNYSTWRWIPQEDGSVRSATLDQLSLPTLEERSSCDTDTKTRADDRGTNVGPPLKRKFEELVRRYPYGISVPKFVSKFKRVYGYYPDYSSFKYFSMEDMCRSLKDIFCVVDSPLSSSEPLLYSVVPGRTWTTLELFKMTWTKIQMVLEQTGECLKLKNIPQKVFDRFNIRINPSDWHLGDELCFYNFCLKTWPPVKPIFLENDIEDPCQKVLVNPCRSFPEALEVMKHLKDVDDMEKLKQVTMSKELILRVLSWKEYVLHGDDLNCVADDIKEGCYYKCLAGAIYTPGNFYVNLMHTWNDLEGLMEEMQKFHNFRERTKADDKPDPDTLEIGLHVAAKRIVDSQWHRSLITDKFSDGKYKVFNIDYGDFEIVGIDSIRYLKTEFFNRMKAQAIRCISKLGRYYNQNIPNYENDLFNRGKGWTEEEGNIMRKKIHDQNLAIKFVSRISVNGSATWQVFVHILDGMRDDVGIRGLHIERTVMEVSRGCYMTATDDESDECGKIELVKDTN